MSLNTPFTGVPDTLTFSAVVVLVGTALNEMALPVPVSDSVAGPVPTLNVLLLPLLEKMSVPAPPSKVLPLPLPVKVYSGAEPASNVLLPLVDPITVVRLEMVSDPTVPLVPAVRLTVTPAEAAEKSMTLLVVPKALNTLAFGVPATKVVFPLGRPL